MLTRSSNGESMARSVSSLPLPITCTCTRGQFLFNWSSFLLIQAQCGSVFENVFSVFSHFKVHIFLKWRQKVMRLSLVLNPSK